MQNRRFGALLLGTVLLGALVVPGGAQAQTAMPATATPSNECVTNPATPKRQLRALWIASVVNIDWPSKAKLDEATIKAEFEGWLDLAQKLKHNAVVVQIRPTADAFWPSPFEPWSEYLTGARDGVSPGWDPLAYLVAASHARNIEFHAWFNPYRVSMPAPSGAGVDISKLAPNHPVRQHPEWAVPYPINNAGGRLYYNPGIPEVRAYVQDAMMDAVAKYDIDAVHFDDYFYPYPAAGQDFGDEATFVQYGAGFASKADWRRDNIDKLVHEMSGRIKAVKPWVKFGVSPFGIWRNQGTDPLGSQTNGTQSYDANFADTRKWVKEEWIDYIVPQIYWNIGLPVADYAKLVPWWSDVVAGTRVQLYIGQADYKIATAGQPAAWFDPTEMSKHLTFNRDYNVTGNIHFSGVQVRANRLGATDIYAADHYSKPALVPAMTHLPHQPLIFPVITGVDRTEQGVELGWRPVASDAGPFGEVTSYAVYRFDGWRMPGACGLADGSNLLTTTRDMSFVDRSAVPGQRYTYVVTELDRLWNESQPSPARFVW